MSRRFLAGLAVLTYGALLGGFLVRLNATPITSVEGKESGANETPEKKLFETTRIWNIHLELSNQEYEAMQPAAGGFNLPGAPPAPPAPKARRINAAANGTFSEPSFLGRRAGSRWKTRPTRTSASVMRATSLTSFPPVGLNDL